MQFVLDFVLDEDVDFFVRKDCYDNNCVYCMKDGRDEIYDVRGDLFPNVLFRSADYIYDN